MGGEEERDGERKSKARQRGETKSKENRQKRIMENGYKLKKKGNC